MENTSPFLFDNTDEKYFLAVGGKAIGPLTAQEIYERVQKGEVGLLNHFWRDGYTDWKRICDEREFAVLIPRKPTTDSIQAIREKLNKKKAAASAAQSDAGGEENFYLYFNRTQYGPFKRAELIHVLKSHKLGRSAYAWTPGWPTWKPMHEIPEFAFYFAPPTPEPEVKKSVRKAKSEKEKSKKISKHVEELTMGVRLNQESGEDASEKRRAPRRPLVARLFMHNEKEVIIAVCRDISVGGMQVLTDRVPGEVGSIIKLNVSPGDSNKVKSFVAEGEIVRVLEDGRGFSFRFKKISEEARRTIEKYIKSDA